MTEQAEGKKATPKKPPQLTEYVVLYARPPLEEQLVEAAGNGTDKADKPEPVPGEPEPVAEGDAFRQFNGTFKATSSRKAIKAAVAQALEEAEAEGMAPGAANGTYVAVPVRSWEPLPVRFENTWQLKLGD